MKHIPIISNIINQIEEDRRIKDELTSLWWAIYNSEKLIANTPKDGGKSLGLTPVQVGLILEDLEDRKSNIKRWRVEFEKINRLKIEREKSKEGIIGFIKYYLIK